MLFPVAPYLEDAEKEIKLDDLVKERVEKHMNSTNSVDHFTDANGTKLVAGAALDAAALADIRKAQQPELDAITLPKAKTPTTKFRKALFGGIPNPIGQPTNYTPRPKHRGWRCNPPLSIATMLKPYSRKP